MRNNLRDFRGKNVSNCENQINETQFFLRRPITVHLLVRRHCVDLILQLNIIIELMQIDIAFFLVMNLIFCLRSLNERGRVYALENILQTVRWVKSTIIMEDLSWGFLLGFLQMFTQRFISLKVSWTQM